jgi:hypothetical protein
MITIVLICKPFTGIHSFSSYMVIYALFGEQRHVYGGMYMVEDGRTNIPVGLVT